MADASASSGSPRAWARWNVLRIGRCEIADPLRLQLPRAGAWRIARRQPAQPETPPTKFLAEFDRTAWAASSGRGQTRPPSEAADSAAPQAAPGKLRGEGRRASPP